MTFPLSSEEPYRRYDGVEILDHSPESVDLTWLNSGNAPLLDTHSMYGLSDQLGVIRKAWIENKRIYVSVEFGRDQKSQDVAANVNAGIIRNVSVGYERIKIGEKNEETDEYRVSRWRPYEASFVPLPADRTVGMGRSAKPKEGNMSNTAENTALPPMTDEMRAQAIAEATQEIKALATPHNMGDVARSFINGELTRGNIPSVAAFKGIAAMELPTGTPLVNEDIGLTDKEKRNFSVNKLLLATDPGAKQDAKDAAGMELEASEAVSLRSGEALFALPTDILGRDFFRAPMGVTGGAGGTALQANPNVQAVDHLSGSFIDNLFNATVLGSMGVTRLAGLSGNVEIPGADVNSNAYWIGDEDGDAQETTPTFRKIELAIKTVGNYTDMSRNFLLQSTIDAENYTRFQLLNSMAEAIDLAGWYGTGTNGQPTGLVNTTGIGSVTFAGAVPTRSELIDMDTSIADTNQTGDVRFATTTNMVGQLRKTKVDAGSAVFLMDNAGRLEIGNSVARTNQITAGDVIAGYFPDMIMGMWGGLEFGRSTESKFLSGGIRIRALQSVDFGARRVGSFVIGNDGA